ncbi:DUF6731 family protein [Streptococcus acidominimus]|uniref:Uncharacterized protein n=1 Tax=Streptococcus acidominimus TaxID=1326 RepID=A0A1Q8EFQ3_STRAI|nr:DUF6731 family protein [Streptococcus acidominimus]OLF50645.1 hypothetical protein BU200_01080 [Streptococcus acidominimus]QBX13667.1 hypothetical protein Javan1_0027 [Streptococcus phage Javan1]SUN05106.1 Uncharacterised protein [Streptococcus acidominimus]
MVKVKKVKFYYCEVIGHEDGRDVAVDFSELFDEVASRYRVGADRFVYELQGTKYKLERVLPPVTINSYYHIVIEKLRDYNYPSRSSLRGESKDLDLQDDEFLGEKMSLLYDPVNNIFMVQVNRNSITVSRIEWFMSSLLSEFGCTYDIRLPIIIDLSPRKQVDSLLGYRSISMKANETFKQGGFVGDLFDAISAKSTSIDSPYFDIEITITAKKDSKASREYLPDSVVENVLSYDIDGSVSKLSVRGRDLTSRIETVDLVSGKISDEYDFPFHESKVLNPTSVFAEMEIIYNEQGRSKALRNFSK